MIEIPPSGVNSRSEQRNISYLPDDAFQCLKIVCGFVVLLRKGMTAVHYEPKCLTVISYIMVYQFNVVGFLISEFVILLDSKFVDLLHICHCGTPPVIL